MSDDVMMADEIMGKVVAAGNLADWYSALLLHALDETGDLREAVRIADIAIQTKEDGLKVKTKAFTRKKDKLGREQRRQDGKLVPCPPKVESQGKPVGGQAEPEPKKKPVPKEGSPEQAKLYKENIDVALEAMNTSELPPGWEYRNDLGKSSHGGGSAIARNVPNGLDGAETLWDMMRQIRG